VAIDERLIVAAQVSDNPLAVSVVQPSVSTRDKGIGSQVHRAALVPAEHQTRGHRVAREFLIASKHSDVG
jgi:hypothetical protein